MIFKFFSFKHCFLRWKYAFCVFVLNKYCFVESHFYMYVQDNLWTMVSFSAYKKTFVI